MRRFMIYVSVIAIAFAQTDTSAWAEDNLIVDSMCKAVAEVSVEGFCKKLKNSGPPMHPALVAAWAGTRTACEIDPAKDFVKEFAQQGCVVVVEKTGETIKVTVRQTKKSARHAALIYAKLNTVEGLQWLMVNLSR